MRTRAEIVTELRARAFRLSVTNSGNGFTDAVIERVADVFYNHQHVCHEHCHDEKHCHGDVR